MQVILSESEYNELKNTKELYKDIMSKIGECFEVIYNEDGNFIRAIAPTVKEVRINMEKVVDLASSRVRSAIKEQEVKIISDFDRGRGG